MMSEGHSSSAEKFAQWSAWAAQARQGDRKAYALLLNEILPYIRVCILPTLANPDWADDIAQEVLLSVHKALHTYSPDRPFKPWLMAIVGFRRTDFLRRQYRGGLGKRAELDVLDFQSVPVTNSGHAGEYKDIEKALRCLPARQRRIVEMMKIKGHTVRETAEELGMTDTAVKVSLHRALYKMRGVLEQ